MQPHDHSQHQHHVHSHASHPSPGKNVSTPSPRHKDHDAGHSAYDKHAGHHTHDFLKRFRLSLLLTIPLLLLSEMIQHWLGFHISFPGDKIILFGLGTLIYFYGGWPFLKGLFDEIRHNAIGMMTLVALAITVAYLYSSAVIFGLKGMDFFWELATLIDIMLLGHWLEMRSQVAASKSLETLVALLPSVVHVEKEGTVHDIELKDLRKDQVAQIKPGEKIPADGIVIEGRSLVNESMLTGESIPVQKEKNTQVIAGSVNGDGSLKIKVTGTGQESYLNKVINLVQTAQATKSKTQNLADRVAKWLTFISIGAGLATFIYWYAEGKGLAFAMERLVTVMVTSCPHALGVAIPLVAAISTTKAAVSGLLIRNRTAFENARKISTVIFDKTGTLTRGSHEVKQVLSLNEQFTPDEILQYASAVQQHSEHYIGKGMLRSLQEKKIPLLRSDDFKYEQGIGVSAAVDGKKISVVGPNFFKHHNITGPVIPTGIDRSTETISFVLVNEKPAGVITLADEIRESAKSAISELKKMNIRSFLLTGDNEQIASSVSSALQMDGFRANVLPHDKQGYVNELKQKGEVVAMAGDGVNDAPALAAADVGIAVGSGTDVAAETADIILVNSDPADVVSMIRFGRQTYRKMVQNLFWAVGYNVVAIPLAAGLLYPDFVLDPALGAILMSASTIVVALNAQLLKKAKVT